VLIRLKKQLAKIHSTPPTLLATSNISPFQNRSHLPPNSIFVNCVASALISISKPPLSLPPPSFSPNLINVLSTTIQSPRVSNNPPPRTLPRAVVKAPESCHTTSILHCLHRLKITAHEVQTPVTYTQSSYNHPTFLSAQPHHCSASSQHSLFISGHSRSSTHIMLRMTDRFFRYASP